HPFTTTYQLEALRHKHPIINGYSGFKSQLQEWLGGPPSPPRGQLAEAVTRARAIGVGYVVLHYPTFASPQDAASLAQAIRSVPGQIVEEHRFGETWAWRLADVSSIPPRAENVSPIDPRTIALDGSHQRSRLEFLTDGDLDTRWLSGGPQGGDEWIELRFAQPTDVARVTIVSSARSLYDYPRHLVVESLGEGEPRPLFDHSIVARLIEAVAVNEQYPAVPIDLPPNHSRAIRLRQTAQGDRWWSVHELRVWKR